MRDPIEGEFRVIGEKPHHQPIISSWSGLFWFVGLTLLAMVLKYAAITSETRNGLRSGGGDTNGNATAEQTATTRLAHKHLTQQFGLSDGTA
jgi:hypothetical protein